MSIVDLTLESTVAVLTMDNGENRQNLAFAQAMGTAIDQALADESVTAIIITSAGDKFFSAGVDLEWMMERFGENAMDDIRAFMYGMNDVFKKCLLAPVPVIAAINGHAFGNGAILACACDFRLMKSDRGFFCFPEVDVSIPFLPGMVAFVKKAIPYYKFNRMKLTGQRVPAPELEAHHIIEQACADKDDLMAQSLAFAGSFNKKRTIFGEHKRRLHKHIIAIMDQEDPEYIEPLNLMV
ncbi:MAG: enoyl-CoA hydratase/isomerase family protein [Desulfosudaceae bacterium]